MASDSTGEARGVSLVICTRNRADALQRCLVTVARVKGPFELIVVDNGSTDATAAVLEAFAEDFSGDFSVVFEGRPGLARARNAGWRAASGDLIVFTDDDCYPEEEFVAAVRQEFDADPELGFLGGRIMLFDPADLPVTIKESMREEYIEPRSFVSAGQVHGANLSFRRVALERCGGFDERLGAGTPYPSEDVEMAARVSALGWRGKYSPGPVVFHHHQRQKPEDEAALRRGYDLGRGAYYAACAINRAPGRWVLQYWVALMRRQPLRRNLREIRGALGYAVGRLLSGKVGAAAASSETTG